MKSAVSRLEEFNSVSRLVGRSVGDNTRGPLKLMLSDWRSQFDYWLIITKQKSKKTVSKRKR